MASIAHWKRRINTHLLQDPVVAAALSPRHIEQHCRDAGHTWRESFWSPATTVLTFLLQVLNPSKTLRAAVAEFLIQLTAVGENDLPSSDPTAYCQARQRLPGEALMRLLVMLANRMREFTNDPVPGEADAPARAAASARAADTADTTCATPRWLGHRVWVFDGSSASMPDEPELQAAFPQPPGQARGCGFPVAQFVALFCWATGAIIDVAIDTEKSSFSQGAKNVRGISGK